MESHSGIRKIQKTDGDRSEAISSRKKECTGRGGEFKFGLTLGQTNTREHASFSLPNATLRHLGVSKGYL